MGSERRFIYGSYYCDQESLVDPDLQPANNSNIEPNQPETLIHYARMSYSPATNNQQRANSQNFRSNNYINRNHFGGDILSYPHAHNNLRNTGSGRILVGNSANSQIPPQCFEFDPRQRSYNSLQTGMSGASNYQVQTSVRDIESVRGLVANAYNNQRPSQSFELDQPQRVFNYNMMNVGGNSSNHTENGVQNIEPPSRNYHGNSISYQNTTYPFIGSRQPNYHTVVGRTSDQYQNNGPFSSMRQDSVYSVGPGPSQQRQSLHMDESDIATKRERSKLMHKIMLMYESSCPSDFLKNREKFEKPDWLIVSFDCCDGLRVYTAEMICVLCFGKVSPQNKDKQPGVLPKWDLSSVTRHLKSFHDESGNGLPLLRRMNRLQSKKNQSIKETEYSNEKDDVGSIVAHSVENVTSEGSNEVEVIKSPAETDEPKDTEEKSVLGKKKRCAEQQLEEVAASLSSSGSSLSEVSLTDSPQESSDSACESTSDLQTDKNATIKQHATRKRQNNKKTNDGNKKLCDKRPVKSRKIVSSSSSSSEAEDTDDWKNPGVTFGWIKLTKLSKFQPAFIYPKEKGKVQEARYIETNGDLTTFKHPIEAIAKLAEVERASKSKKCAPYLKAIKSFNAKNKTKY